MALLEDLFWIVVVYVSGLCLVFFALLLFLLVVKDDPTEYLEGHRLDPLS